MNIGGRRITNAELARCFEELDFTDVSPFLASGNVVFEGQGDAKAVRERVCAGLEEKLGYPVPTFIRTAREVREVADRDPFSARPRSSLRGKLQVAFLREEATPAAIAAVAAQSNDDDWLALVRRELYWLPKGKLSDSGLKIRPLEKLLGPTTIRTKNTIVRLRAKHFAAS